MNRELQDIKELIRYIQLLDEDIAKDEAALNEKKARLDFFVNDAIPDFILGLGLSEVKLDTGETVTVKTNYFGNISEERSAAAFKWLREHNQGSLIKSEVRLNFTSSQEDQVDKLVLAQFIKEKELSAVEKEAVHPQTLKSFIKNSMEDGVNFPYPLFGVFVSKQVVVGAKKQ
jgi:hypothetical protein